MKPKYDNFARKHTPEVIAPEKDLLPVPPKFADFFVNHYNFNKRFLKLGYDDQIELVNCLYNISSSSSDSIADLSLFYLKKIHELTDSAYEEGVYKPVAVDEKRLIRMDCYGSINRRRPDQLSDLYQFFQSRKETKKHLLREYNLSDSPNWKIMAQFESFRSIAPQIKSKLHQLQLNPDILKIMTINDFCDFIYNTFSNGSDKAHFIKAQESVKARFIRQFIDDCGDAFYRTLIDQGIDERCVKSLYRKMARFGSCDLDSLIVTETHYTERVLHDLQQNGFNTRNLEVGMPIPEDFIDFLIDSKNEQLILARNDDGSLVNKYMLPRLEVHHNSAVKFANAEYLASSNYPNRLVLIESKMHQEYYHLFDSIIKQNQMQNYYSRLNIANHYMRMRIGFAPQNALYGNFENNKEFLHRAAEDRKNLANYFDCQKEYAQNVAFIAEKYHIDIKRYGAPKTQNIKQTQKHLKKLECSTRIRRGKKNSGRL